MSVENCQFRGSVGGEKSEPHDDDDARIHDETRLSKQQCRDYINSKLGAGTQPVLETVRYQVCNIDSPRMIVMC